MSDQKIPWTVLKLLIDTSQFRLFYLTFDDKYIVYTGNNVKSFYAYIFIENPRNSEQIDFEDNYKNNANDIYIYNQYTAGGRLKVDADLVSVSTGALSQYPNNLKYLDINVSNGGVARGSSITNASWVDIFSYTGSGSIMSFFINLEHNHDWQIRFLIDGIDVFGAEGLLSSDFLNNSIYNLNEGSNENSLQESLGVLFKSNGNFIWSSPLNTPTRYNSSVTIKLKRVSGSNAKKFQAGIVTLTQET